MQKKIWSEKVTGVKQVLCVLILAVLLFSQGCCSLFKSDNQVITIDSEPDGADVEVGPYRGKTPYTVDIPRGKEYTIRTTLNGETQTRKMNKEIAGLYWVNILIWPGLIVDLATGKMFEYQPATYNFNFSVEK
jgi:hypothetical protein